MVLGQIATDAKSNEISLFLDDPACAPIATAQIVDGDHGRIETRTAMVSGDIDWLQKQHNWPGLAAVAKVERTREEPSKTTHETAYYTPLRSEPENPWVR